MPLGELGQALCGENGPRWSWEHLWPMGIGWFPMAQRPVNLSAPVCLQGGEQLDWGERVTFSLCFSCL